MVVCASVDSRTCSVIISVNSIMLCVNLLTERCIVHKCFEGGSCCGSNKVVHRWCAMGIAKCVHKSVD